MSQREEYAEAFDRSADPLAEYSDTFYDLKDPFDHFVEVPLENRETIETEGTIEDYERDYDQWRNHMATTDRHPACPNLDHVQSFIRWRRDAHDNSRRTLKQKLNRLTQAYEHWQADSALPHPSDYNPFELAEATTDLGHDDDKGFPELPLETLQSEFDAIENIRSRAIIGSQLKLGLRAGEVCNIQLQDIHLSHSELVNHYDDLGTHPALNGHSDVIYIPHDRDGTKASNPRLLPIDDEFRWLLIRYLLTRPQVDESWVFLSKRSFSKLNSQAVNRVWKAEFHPEYAETDDHRAITSHFGRHWFSTYWRMQGGMAREHVQYMRGDRVQPIESFGDAIDEYLHPRYDHIESEYRSNIFPLGFPLNYSPLEP